MPNPINNGYAAFNSGVTPLATSLTPTKLMCLGVSYGIGTLTTETNTAYYKLATGFSPLQYAYSRNLA
jgi:hypothetical protein